MNSLQMKFVQSYIYKIKMFKKRSKTQIQQQEKHVYETDQKMSALDKIIAMTSQEKLLPKFLYQLEAKCSYGRKQKFIEYQKMIKHLYGQQGRVPLKYNPEEALTHRQKFRIKVLKLLNNELDIDYFQKVRTKQGNIIPLFKGYPIENIKYETNKQFIIFKDFNQNKFRKSYTQIFDDQLQLKEQSLLRKQRKKVVSLIRQSQSSTKNNFLPNPKFNKFSHEQKQLKEKNFKKVKKIKFRPLTEAIERQKEEFLPPVKKINQKYRPHIQKKVIGKMINDIQNQKLYQKMMRIGGFPASVSESGISLTKQSFSKYLKLNYERQIRILDFLQVKPAFTLVQYHNLCTKLKLMPVEHVIFMTFLFYDFNNDGYICQNDMRRVKALYQNKNNQLIEEDFKIICALKEKIQQRDKKPLNSNYEDNPSQQKNQQNKQKYLQLYRLPQITESTYFNWLNKQSKIVNEQSNQKLQIKQLQGRQRKSISQKNPFNPSVLKFKANFHEQKSQIRKYLLSIKANKIYIGYEQFKMMYFNKQQNRKLSYSVDNQNSRISQFGKGLRSMSKKNSLIGSSRYQIDVGRNKSIANLNQNKSNLAYQKKNTNISQKLSCFTRPYLWYDLMDKIAGVRFEKLKYE